MATFQVEVEMEEKIERTIRKRKVQRAVGADGVYVEMIQVVRKARTKLLYKYWKTAGSLDTFL